jgi:hypothetical protein
MRTFLAAAIAAVTVLAFGGYAYAANTYETHVASTKPSGKGGTPSRPKPLQVNFGFRVGETDPLLRPAGIETYRIASEGLVTFPQAFPKCSFSDTLGTDPAAVARKCRRAKMGEGIVKALAGADSNRAKQGSIVCNQKLVLYNIGDGLALRLDGDPPAPPPDSDQLGCGISFHNSVRTKFVRRRIGGMPSSSLEFKVPQNVLHAVPGLTTSVIESVTKIQRKTAFTRVRGKRRRVGYYNAIGCRGRTRLVQTTFITEGGGQRFTARRESKC